MSKQKIFVGDVSGRFIVISRLPRENNRTYISTKCTCGCGEIRKMDCGDFKHYKDYDPKHSRKYAPRKEKLLLNDIIGYYQITRFTEEKASNSDRLYECICMKCKRTLLRRRDRMGQKHHGCGKSNE